MIVMGQLVETVLNLGSDGLGGEKEHLFALVRVQELIGDGPGVD